MRIGLIAMSGVRTCDDELLRTGLTLPGFIERSKVIASLPSLGLLTLAGMTPKRHKVEYTEIADLALHRATHGLPDGFDLVGISSYTAQIHEAYELAEELRGRGVPVVMGGLHVSSLPDEAAAHCDAVVLGEGESSWPQVLADAERGELKPRYQSLRRDWDLADAPMPAYELLDVDKYNRLTVQTSRGCPFVCEFCASSILLTGRYEQKPAERVLAEIDRICDIWERPFTEFADDNSFVNRAYWRALLPEIAKRRIRWFTETDISVAQDAELLTLMREAGCAQVLIGLESPTAEALDGIEVRQNWKRKQWSFYREAIRTIQSHGISVNGCFVVGLDGHGPDVFDEVYDFVRDTELAEVQITLPTPFPGTPLYHRLLKAGRLLDEKAWQRCTLFDVNFKPARMSVDELRDGFVRLSQRLYSGSFTRERRAKFRSYLREATRAARSLPA